MVNTNVKLTPMNRMHGENTVSLTGCVLGCGWEGSIGLSNKRSCSWGSELVLNTNEELKPMNRMHGENTVSLTGYVWGVGGVYGV